MAKHMSTQRMTSATEPAQYISARDRVNGKALLVAIDTENPWDAFKAMRRSMRKARSASTIDFGLIESETALEHTADVIHIEARRRAG